MYLILCHYRSRDKLFVTNMNKVNFTLNSFLGSIIEAQAKLKAGKDVRFNELEITRVKESIDLTKLRITEWILSANVVLSPGDSLQDIVQVQVNQDWMALQVIDKDILCIIINLLRYFNIIYN